MNDCIDFTNPYELNRLEKQELLASELQHLNEFHYNNCPEYKNIINTIFPNFRVSEKTALEDMPFIPVSLFKYMHLKSIAGEQVFKTLSSSGTSTQLPSKIVLDRDTAQLQSRVLAAIVSNFIGTQRLPMIIIDQQTIVSNRAAFNARAAGIIGFSGFGRDHLYLLDDNMEVKATELRQFLHKHQNEKILVFGFTFMVWKYFYLQCLQQGLDINLNDGIIIHGGGWKKMQSEAIDEKQFKQKMMQQFNAGSVHNYYGFIEQVGSIFMECERGYFHAPKFSEVLIRDQSSLQLLPFNQQGLIQGISIIPKSYPGISVLTEDLGVCIGEDDCACGRYGKYFQVIGRVPAAEVRGCSDTH